MINNAFYDAKYGKRLKILTLKQMVQRLPIALAQVKAGNISENLLNEIRQIIYSLIIIMSRTRFRVNLHSIAE